MERRIDAHIARTQFGQIMDRAVENNERFVVERRGEPAVVIMSVQDFIRTVAPPPDWLQKAWKGAASPGPRQINACGRGCRDHCLSAGEEKSCLWIR